MIDPRRLAIYGISAFVLLVGALGTYARVQGRRAQTAELLATEAGKRESIWKDHAENSDRAAAFNEEKVRAKEAEVRALQAKLDALPRPTPPKPAPADDAQLAEGLVTAGMAPGLRVLLQTEPKASILGHLDATRVWMWQQDALRVPPLEARLGAALDLSNGQGQLIEAQKAQVLDLTTSRNAWKGAASAADERADALNKETKALRKSLTAEKWQKWALVGGALAAGYYAGRGR